MKFKHNILKQNSFQKLLNAPKISTDHQKLWELVRGELKANVIPGQMFRGFTCDTRTNSPCCVFHEDALSFQLHKQLPTCKM